MKSMTEEEVKYLVKQAYLQGYKDAAEILIMISNGKALDDILTEASQKPSQGIYE